jgi:hypothetical protein
MSYKCMLIETNSNLNEENFHKSNKNVFGNHLIFQTILITTTYFQIIITQILYIYCYKEK